ncbi:DedA family protein [Puniceibacterium sediminis]|uniref:Membrane protein DedA, SNARE-associated domain n=1 Tax=Puniceibacterium sediminis TaxID=1608407 RepID=A0A238VV17_9RHOB|nr:DedA family protein [Puniceibacterium sediminis]SNR37997.1 membrane protein DedA, SNARE-associated domain [Puniceibacterium sediminis]
MFDVITNWLSAMGSFGVALLMFLENVFPPIPSELVMPFAGYLSARGEMSFVTIVLLGTIGSVTGAVLWYWVGLWADETRLRRFIAGYGKWLTLSNEDLDRALAWFRRHGAGAVFFGRMVPGVRTLISVPAGLTRMPMLPFLLSTALGSFLWTVLLAAAGYLLRAHFDRVADWLNPITNALLLLLLGLYLWRALRGVLRS